MAKSAVAREAVSALRREIARIEGVLPERLESVEQGAEADPAGFLRTGADHFDAALGGGLPKAALTEILGAESRDGAAVAGFALAMASRIQASENRQGQAGRVLWVGLSTAFTEAGFPYGPGLHRLFALSPSSLLFATARRLDDTLWIAEEAVACAGFCAIVVELQGNPKRLDLTATRRLHLRAAQGGRPLFLLRQSAMAMPTAAPLRLLVQPASSTPRRTLSGLVPQSIGPPAFRVTVDKHRGRPAASLRLEWNRHDLAFQESRPEDTGALVPASAIRPHPAAQAWPVMALDPGRRQTG